MIVRDATEDDLSDYIRMGRLFHQSCPLNNTIEFDDEGFSEFYRAALENDSLGVWVAEDDGEIVGICSAIAYGMYFNPSSIVVQEMWWWTSSDVRGKGAGSAMFKHLEQWATEKNASALFMIALQNDDSDRVCDIYTRKGFRPMERTFFREVV